MYFGTVNRTVNKNCSAVSMMLTSQMKKWNMNTESYCTQTGSEKCLYDVSGAGVVDSMG